MAGAAINNAESERANLEDCELNAVTMANSPTPNTHKRCRMHNTHGFMPKTYWEIKEPQAANMERTTKNKTVLRKKFIT